MTIDIYFWGSVLLEILLFGSAWYLIERIKKTMTPQEQFKIETQGVVIMNDWEIVQPLEFGVFWTAYVKSSLN